jgi:Sulfatase-modifying factor enzyme 1
MQHLSLNKIHFSEGIVTPHDNYLNSFNRNADATPQHGPHQQNPYSPNFGIDKIYSPENIVTPYDNLLHPLNRCADVTPQHTPSQQNLHSPEVKIYKIYSPGSPYQGEMVDNILRRKVLTKQACTSFVEDVLQNAANKKQACTSVLEELLQNVEKEVAAKQTYASVMQEILKKAPKQHAWTTAQGPTGEVSSTPQYISELKVAETGTRVYPKQEYPAPEDSNKRTTDLEYKNTSDGSSAHETQTRPSYFKYPGFAGIGGIGMGIGGLGLSGIPWIATYAEDQISYVTIGDAGNLPDPFAYPESWGSVDYEFEISTTPVTVVQWLAHLNTVARKEDNNGLWNDAMPIIRNGTQGRYSYSLKDPDKKNQPITHVSYTNAKSYCQWQSDTSGNSENTDSAITYDIPTPDEYLKAHFYNPKALEEHGDYESTPCDTYGTKPPQENFYEWTRGADTEREPFILSTSTTSPFNVEQREPKIEREDLGFSVVKRTSISLEQKNKQEKEYLEKTRSYCQKKSQDNTLDEDKKQLWSNAAVSLSSSITCLDNSQQEPLDSCKTAAAFYLESIQASLSLREFHELETECWNNAGDYVVNALTNQVPDHQQDYEEALSFSIKAAIEYTFLNKDLAYNYASEAYDAVKNFDPQTSAPTINKLSPFIEKIGREK